MFTKWKYYTYICIYEEKMDRTNYNQNCVNNQIITIINQQSNVQKKCCESAWTTSCSFFYRFYLTCMTNPGTLLLFLIENIIFSLFLGPWWLRNKTSELNTWKRLHMRMLTQSFFDLKVHFLADVYVTWLSIFRKGYLQIYTKRIETSCIVIGWKD